MTSGINPDSQKTHTQADGDRLVSYEGEKKIIFFQLLLLLRLLQMTYCRREMRITVEYQDTAPGGFQKNGAVTIFQDLHKYPLPLRGEKVTLNFGCF